jgi:hypothetical protein
LGSKKYSPIFEKTLSLSERKIRVERFYVEANVVPIFL